MHSSVRIESPGGSQVRLNTIRRPSGDQVGSPDGRLIAFGGGREGGVHNRDDGIYVLDVASGRSTRLTSGPHGGPDWSPDGTKIAFAGGYEKGAIFVMKRNGTGRRVIVPASTQVWSPSWSPDGSKIAYARAVGDARASHQIIIVGSGGKGSRLLLRGAWTPDWRPKLRRQ